MSCFYFYMFSLPKGDFSIFNRSSTFLYKYISRWCRPKTLACTLGCRFPIDWIWKKFFPSATSDLKWNVSCCDVNIISPYGWPSRTCMKRLYYFLLYIERAKFLNNTCCLVRIASISRVHPCVLSLSEEWVHYCGKIKSHNDLWSQFDNPVFEQPHNWLRR